MIGSISDAAGKQQNRSPKTENKHSVCGTGSVLPSAQARKEQVVMKRLISAISSLAIAATAIGGTLAMSTSAAVDKTIIEFATEKDGKRVNTIEAKAGDKIPFSIYVPQSSGINTLSLKLSINGGKTLGEGLVEYPALDSEDGKKYYATTEGAKDKDKAGTTAKHKWAFGNYGITMSDGAYASPYCFDSRSFKYNGKKAALCEKKGISKATLGLPFYVDL